MAQRVNLSKIIHMTLLVGISRSEWRIEIVHVNIIC